jgi:hypothetical protein
MVMYRRDTVTYHYQGKDKRKKEINERETTWNGYDLSIGA